MNVRLALFGASTVALMIVAGAGVYWLARHPSPPPAGAQESAAAGQDQNANIAVNVTAAQCDPSELTVPAGRVTFAIHNSGERALEWEILQGVMVVEER